MDQFILNLIHRPEMVPEYSATVTGQGKEEDIGDKALLTESLDIFKTQQRLAHENGLKVTIQMTYASLFNDEAVEIAKHDTTYTETRSHYPCSDFRVRSSVRNTRPRISVSGCSPWRTRKPSSTMCLRSSMTDSDSIRSQPVPTTWMPI